MQDELGQETCGENDSAIRQLVFRAREPGNSNFFMTIFVIKLELAQIGDTISVPRQHAEALTPQDEIECRQIQDST
jgi:hypothetical protein